MKALAWDYQKNKFVSPARNWFTWDKDGLTSCECSHCKEAMPGKDCGCGLYATFRWEEVMGYVHNSPISPIILFEISGKSQFYQDIFRAKQLAPYAVVDWQEGSYMQHMASLQASEYYEIPLIPRSRAIVIMDLWNIVWFMANRYNFRTPEGDIIEIPYWRTWYEPEADKESNGYISQITDEKLEQLALELTGGEICKSKENMSISTTQPVS